jgi:murein DD-endopeptidase MepM/ murein hydrolase activator NlpD
MMGFPMLKRLIDSKSIFRPFGLFLFSSLLSFSCSSADPSLSKPIQIKTHGEDTVQANQSIVPRKVSLFNGGVVLLVSDYRPATPTIELKCGEQNILAFYDGIQLIAVLGENYFSSFKNYECIYNEGNQSIKLFEVEITKKDYKFEKLSVDQKTIDLSKENQERASREQIVLNKIYASSSKVPLFKSGFIMPLNSYITSYYGTGRMYNNKKKSPHLGTDFRASVGEAIPATNDGLIVFAGDLFYTGYTVIIDHGLNIFSVYGNLSELKVSAGQLIKKGVLIAKSGMSGRVSGPHLHWGVKINGQYIDGSILVEQTSKM